MESKIWDHVGFLRPNRTIYGFVKGHVEYICTKKGRIERKIRLHCVHAKQRRDFAAASRQILQRSYCRRASQTVITGNSINDAGNVIYRITDKRKCARKSRLNYKPSIVFIGLSRVWNFVLMPLVHWILSVDYVSRFNHSLVTFGNALFIYIIDMKLWNAFFLNIVNYWNVFVN